MVNNYYHIGGPGPGSYHIKTTMGKLLESNIRSPCQYSLRSRTKFGDPNEKSMNKTTASEPGYGIWTYDNESTVASYDDDDDDDDDDDLGDIDHNLLLLLVMC